MQRLPQLYIAQTENKGRGVFTALDIPTSSLIEICPVIVIPKAQMQWIDRTVFYDYYFIWQNDDLAMALGYGSLYNHSSTPNAEVVFDFDSQQIHIQALKEIEAGEEITIHYHNDDKYKGELWFEVKM